MNAERPGFAVSLGRWIVAALVSSVLLPAATVVALVSERRGLRAWSAWGRLLQRIFGVRLAVQDLNRGHYDRGPYVFVQLNQRSLSETFVLHAAMPIPIRLFTNIEFALLPLGWCMWLTGSVVVVRQWPWQRRRALAKAIAYVRAGESFYISIEGGRAPGGTALPFKKGPAMLAIQGGATVVPVVFDGAAQALPHGDWRVRAGTIRVTLLEAIPTHGLSLDERGRLTQALERIAAQRVHEPTLTNRKANAN